MAKPHRGKGIRELPSHGRGVCPVCNRSGVKLLYEQDGGEGKIKTCKTCRAAVKSGKKKLPGGSASPAASAAPAAPAAAPAAPAPAAPAPAASAPAPEAAPAAEEPAAPEEATAPAEA